MNFKPGDTNGEEGMFWLRKIKEKKKMRINNKNVYLFIYNEILSGINSTMAKQIAKNIPEEKQSISVKRHNTNNDRQYQSK